MIWLPTLEVDAQTEFTVITGLVRSELNQLPLAGVRVTVLGKHAPPGNSTAETALNGEYIVIARTTDSSGDPIPFPIEITFTKEGFQPTKEMLQESEKVNGVITRDVLMSGVIPPSDSIELKSPPDGQEFIQSVTVTVFRWTRSDNPDVISYRLEIADNPDMVEPKKFPQNSDPIVAPQVDVQLFGLSIDPDIKTFHWHVIGIGLNKNGDPVDVEISEVFSFKFEPPEDSRGFTVITGIVKSDFNQAALVGARVAVSGAHAGTFNDIAATEFNGEYIVIALTVQARRYDSLSDRDYIHQRRIQADQSIFAKSQSSIPPADDHT